MCNDVHWGWPQKIEASIVAMVIDHEVRDRFFFFVVLIQLFFPSFWLIFAIFWSYKSLVMMCLCLWWINLISFGELLLVCADVNWLLLGMHRYENFGWIWYYYCCFSFVEIAPVKAKGVEHSQLCWLETQLKTGEEFILLASLTVICPNK